MADTTKELAVAHTKEIVTYYRNKYYSLFMNSRKFKGLSYSQNYYLMKLLYSNGTALVFTQPVAKLPSEKGNLATTSEDDKDQVLVITSYSSTDFNMYQQPTRPQPINIKGDGLVPNKKLDATNSVILWAHTSHKSIQYLLDFYIKKIADIEVALEMNVYIQRVPKLFTVTPSDEKRVKEIANKIDAGVRQLFITADDWQAIKQVLDSGQNYIIDKLYKYKQQLESECLEILGYNSVQYEKTERITDEEAQANDSETQGYSDAITETIRQGCELVRDRLGYDLEVVENITRKESGYENTGESQSSVYSQGSNKANV